jgi:Ser/Thr protein kinase RdoA (MazF antagonist)
MTSSDALIEFDHGLRRHLLAAGIPTAAPVPARDGGTATRVEGSAFEVYPFVPGRALPRAGDAALAGAARALAAMHRASAGYPAARSLPPVAQYSTLGVPESSDRMEDPALLTRIYDGLAARPEAAAFTPDVAVCLRWLVRLVQEFDRAAYDRLPHTVTHGDFTLANLLFSEHGEVAGIFDFDWARWAPRVRDLADGMFFIAGERRVPLRPGDIWSLTEAVELRVERCAAWLRYYQAGYHDGAGLTPDEIVAVPLALAARWLSVRAEGTAKVPAAEQVRFCFREAAVPLRWLEQRWPAVAAALAG